MRTERRRHPDTAPRITNVQCNVRGQCELVLIGSLAHTYMLRMGWDELDVTDGAALMRPPVGWADAKEPRA